MASSKCHFGEASLPDELRELVPVFVVARAAALGGEIELVPPFELGLRRQRHLAGFLAADQIAAHGDHGLAALRPERRDDVGGPRAPIEAGEDRLLDLESIHQGDDVDGERRRLAIAERLARKKTRRAVAAQIRDDHPVARRRQQRRDIDVAVNVVGPAVQKNDRRAIGGTGFGVADIQDAGIDLLQRAERDVRPRLDRGQLRLGGLCVGRSRACRAESAAAVMAAAPMKMAAMQVDFSAMLVFMVSLLWFDGSRSISRT